MITRIRLPHRHLSGSAKSGQPRDPAKPAPAPPPRWRSWLPGIGLALTMALLLWSFLLGGTGPASMPYSDFVAKTSNALPPEERHAVAVHESGHALRAALCAHADPVAKVTILPAGPTLGTTERLPEAERHLYSESYLTDLLAVRLGGRAAELVVFGEGSTGAANDLTAATQIAGRMACEFGLSPALGPVGYTTGTPDDLGQAPPELLRRPYSEQTQRVIDEEVTRLLRQAEQCAVGLLHAHRAALDRLAALLVEQETVDGAVVLQVIADEHAQPEEHEEPADVMSVGAAVHGTC